LFLKCFCVFTFLIDLISAEIERHIWHSLFLYSLVQYCYSVRNTWPRSQTNLNIHQRLKQLNGFPWSRKNTFIYVTCKSSLHVVSEENMKEIRDKCWTPIINLTKKNGLHETLNAGKRGTKWCTSMDHLNHNLLSIF
jgi:hypothetical protein